MPASPPDAARGGDQEAFQAPGAYSKYRLGNEIETYGELGFDITIRLAGRRCFALLPPVRSAAYRGEICAVAWQNRRSPPASGA